MNSPRSSLPAGRVFTAPRPGTTIATPTLILTGRYQCPVCGKLRFDTVPRSGDLFDACQRRDCAAPWWAAIFPPDLNRLDIISRFPKHYASIANVLGLRFGGDDLPLLGPDKERRRAYLVIPIAKHQRHRLLFAPVGDILALAGITPG